MTPCETREPGGAPLRDLPLAYGEDAIALRRAAAGIARDMGFSTLDQTRIVTAASELARNVIVHGGGGRASIRIREQDGRSAIVLTFDDDGPGIVDLDEAFTDGFSSKGGLGLGLGGARRLMDELRVEARAAGGTRVVTEKWTAPVHPRATRRR